jgi:hypothetical protein
MRQEGRHIDFYSSTARQRLAESATARRITRFALRRYWAPVGAGVMPQPELEFLVRHLFGDDEGRVAAQRIDRLVGRLPGLEGLHLIEEALDDLALAPPQDIAVRAALRRSAQENQTKKEQRRAC